MSFFTSTAFVCLFYVVTFIRMLSLTPIHRENVKRTGRAIVGTLSVVSLFCSIAGVIGITTSNPTIEYRRSLESEWSAQGIEYVNHDGPHEKVAFASTPVWQAFSASPANTRYSLTLPCGADVEYKRGYYSSAEHPEVGGIKGRPTVEALELLFCN